MKDKIFIAKQIMNKIGLRTAKSEVHRRQMELNKIYVANPNQASIVDSGESSLMFQRFPGPFSNQPWLSFEWKV